MATVPSSSSCDEALKLKQTAAALYSKRQVRAARKVYLQALETIDTGGRSAGGTKTENHTNAGQTKSGKPEASSILKAQLLSNVAICATALGDLTEGREYTERCLEELAVVATKVSPETDEQADKLLLKKQVEVGRKQQACRNVAGGQRYHWHPVARWYGFVASAHLGTTQKSFHGVLLFRP